jgi:hypothetical protein
LDHGKAHTERKLKVGHLATVDVGGLGGKTVDGIDGQKKPWKAKGKRRPFYRPQYAGNSQGGKTKKKRAEVLAVEKNTLRSMLCALF